METSKLKRFAQFARRSLIEQVTGKLELVLADDSAARRESTNAVKKLEEQVNLHGKEQVIEKVAYIWFNRFCALRFMDVNRYTHIGIVSPAERQFQPEILAEAKMGHIDEGMVPEKTRQKIFNLLDGTVTSHDPQLTAYRLLVVAVCNSWHATMPFMFEHIIDYTELLMPDDLLSGNSILAYTREAMTPDICQDVEVIGWLYQFYISEKKDEVFYGLKKNQKITPENIPAATQLFTPHYIVRYLVENSLGSLWMLNRPTSRLVEHMEYYIEPEDLETNFLKIKSPEEIKICDPACGSGHMLTYAFDLLYIIYEEEGYDIKEIPGLILTRNLYGIEIDERAGELASFALFMKAREKYRRFFRKPVQPNICVLENVGFSGGELKPYIDTLGRDLFTVNLQAMLNQFQEADNFGSLISPAFTEVAHIRRVIEEKELGSKIYSVETHLKVLKALEQADYLRPKYHVVIANPPYMGGKGMNGRLKSFAQEHFKESKSDLFSMFMERNLDLVHAQGLVAMITMQSWMFLSSFEKLRNKLLYQDTILSMAHLGARAFDSFGGEVVSTTAFVLENSNHLEYKGGYIRIVDGNSEAEKESAIREAINKPDCGWFYCASAADFIKVPGGPIAYWASSSARNSFWTLKKLGDVAEVKAGMSTSNNDRFLRYWFEVSIINSSFNCLTTSQAKESMIKWFPFNKGGGYRSWYGNLEYLVNWQNDGAEIKKAVVSNAGDPDTTHWSRRIYNTEYYFKPCITWSLIGGNNIAFRYSPAGAIISHKGPGIYFGENGHEALSFLNSKTTGYFLGLMRQGLGIEVGHISKIPVAENFQENYQAPQIDLAKNDWNSHETSWDFTNLPLLQFNYQQPLLNATYRHLRNHWKEITLKMQHLEEENNRIFIDAYGLQDELTPDVPLNKITLTCNPHYRYNSNKSEEKLEALLLSDTMKEFFSYAVGCMFGRYSLDKPGLILANQGEDIKNYMKKIPEPSFTPDADNVIPIFDQDWFLDDITSRFYEFLKVTFGHDHYDENLKFIIEAIGKDIRKYFLTDFYKDHLKTYKKRPIYWLFSSPKGSFNALIYMHRYRPDTVSIILNDYLREFRIKLIARREHLEQVSISASASKTERTRAFKEIEKLKKTIAELDTYENETLYPLATQNIEIDLDDGVKVNYKRFGKALKKVAGLS